jgi:hypothetical protein
LACREAIELVLYVLAKVVVQNVDGQSPVVSIPLRINPSAHPGWVGQASSKYGCYVEMLFLSCIEDD